MKPEQNRPKKVTTLTCINLVRQLNEHYINGVPSRGFVLLTLVSHRAESGAMFPSQETLARETGYGLSIVGRALRFWRELGVLSWTKGRYVGEGKATPNQYTFHMERAAELVRCAQEKVTGTGVPVTLPLTGTEGKVTGTLDEVTGTPVPTKSNAKEQVQKQEQEKYQEQVNAGTLPPALEMEPPETAESNEVAAVAEVCLTVADEREQLATRITALRKRLKTAADNGDSGTQDFLNRRIETVTRQLSALDAS